MAEVSVAELTADERRDLARLHPEIREDRPALVISMEDPLERTRLESVLAALGDILETVSRRERAERERERAKMARAIEALTPDLEVSSAAAVLQARRNAEARSALAREFGLRTSAQVAELAGSQARNRAALANRWTKEGRVFPVTHAGARLWPGFQFDAEGQPLPVVAEILTAFGERAGGWEAALWFMAASGWLEGRRPVDLLREDPEAVVTAARREVEELVF